MMQPPPAGQKVGRSSRVGVTALIATIAVGVLFALVVDRNRQGNDSFDQHVAVYGVTGSGTTAKVVYLMPPSADGSQGGGQAFATVTLPWSASFKASAPVSFELSASAVDSGPLTCTITLDGKLVQTGSGSTCSVAAAP
jgi:Mycobacterium membrane protein